MPGISDHPDDFDREWAYRRGYAHGAEAAVAALRPHLPEAIRRKAEVWLACELLSWRAQFHPKMTQPPEFRLTSGVRSGGLLERLGMLVGRCFPSLLWRG